MLPQVDSKHKLPRSLLISWAFPFEFLSRVKDTFRRLRQIEAVNFNFDDAADDPEMKLEQRSCNTSFNSFSFTSASLKRKQFWGNEREPQQTFKWIFSRFYLLVIITFDIKTKLRINKTEDEATSDTYFSLLCVTLKTKKKMKIKIKL